MLVKEAQSEVRRVDLGGLVGQSVSPALVAWLKRVVAGLRSTPGSRVAGQLDSGVCTGRRTTVPTSTTERTCNAQFR